MLLFMRFEMGKIARDDDVARVANHMEADAVEVAHEVIVGVGVEPEIEPIFLAVRQDFAVEQAFIVMLGNLPATPVAGGTEDVPQPRGAAFVMSEVGANDLLRHRREAGIGEQCRAS